MPESLSRWLAGASGGLAASAVKYVGQDHDRVAGFLMADQAINAINLGLGYLILVPILMVLGSLVAYFSDENHRMKLFIMGIAAPALITTWAGGPRGDSIHALSFVSPAHAEESVPATTNVSVLTGIKMFFGYQPQDKYQVIVGSFKTPAEAEALAEKVNQEDPTLKASVAKSQKEKGPYTVRVGTYSPLLDAMRLQKRALQLNAVEGAYLKPNWSLVNP